jgi:hypothetical protein
VRTYKEILLSSELSCVNRTIEIKNNLELDPKKLVKKKIVHQSEVLWRNISSSKMSGVNKSFNCKIHLELDPKKFTVYYRSPGIVYATLRFGI